MARKVQRYDDLVIDDVFSSHSFIIIHRWIYPSLFSDPFPEIRRTLMYRALLLLLRYCLCIPSRLVVVMNTDTLPPLVVVIVREVRCPPNVFCPLHITAFPLLSDIFHFHYLIFSPYSIHSLFPLLCHFHFSITSSSSVVCHILFQLHRIISLRRLTSVSHWWRVTFNIFTKLCLL